MTMALAVVMVACQGAVKPPATVAKEIGDIEFAAGAGASKITLTGYFEVTSPTYTAKSSNTSVATVSVSGAVLTVTPIGAGSANVEVTATGDEGTVSQTFKVTVAKPDLPPANNPPTVRTISPVSLEVAETEPITLSEYFTDPEGNALTYTADSSNDAIATVTDPDANSMITITAVAAGRATITVTANDGTNAAVSQTFRVTVTDAEIPDNNQPYRTAPLPNLTGLKVGVSPDPIDLSNHFSDDEDDDLDYNASPVDDGVVTVDVSGSMLTITVVAPGTTTINVTVADDANNQVRGSFDVMVVNQAPMIVTNEPTRFGPYLPGDTLTITVSEYFTDAEGDSLTYTAASDDVTIATVTDPNADSNITITAAAVGEAMITITADDGESITSHMLTVTVSAVPNVPPVISMEIPDQSLKLVVDEATMTESATTTLDLMDHFNDPDGGQLSYSTDSEMATVADSMLTITASVPGTTMITVTASDGAAQISDTFDVVVTSPEAPATSSELSDQNFDHDDMVARTFMLSSYFMRATGYAVDSDDPTVVMAAEADGVLTLTPVGAGRTVVTVTPSNSGGSGSAQTITVTVDPTPTPTATSELPDQIFAHDDMDARMFTLSGYFSGATSYAVDSDDPTVVMAAEADGVLTLTPVGTGRAVVTVTPSNSSGSGSAQTITVTVDPTPVPTSIKPLQAVTTQTDANPTTIMLSEYFSNATSYDVGSNNTPALEAAVADGTLTLTPGMHGMATVTVTPINSGGRGTAQTFDVTVQTRPTLKSSMMFDDKRLIVRADNTTAATVEALTRLTLDLSTYFEDLDGSIVKYSTETGDTKKVFVYTGDTIPATKDDRDGADMAEGANVVLETRATDPDGSGTDDAGYGTGMATITIMVTDNDMLVTTETFKVMVVAGNGPPVAATLGGEAAIPSYTGDSRFKLGDDPEKPIDNEEINDYFTDANLTETQGDLLTFSVKYVAPGAVTDEATVTSSADLAADKIVATAKVSTPNWDGDIGGVDKFTVTVTPVMMGDAHDIVLIATDLAGRKAYHLISVQVNHRPVAEGAVAADSTDAPGTLTKLSEDYDDLAVSTGFGTVGHEVTLVEDDGGYFSDEDDATAALSCRFNTRGAGIFADEYPQWETPAERRQLNLAADATTAFAAKGTAYVDVWCTDAAGEPSPMDTLTITVTSQGSIH